MSARDDNLQKGTEKKRSMLFRESSFHSLVEIPTYVTCKVTLEGVKQDSGRSQYDSEEPEYFSLEKALSIYQRVISEEEKRNIQLMEKRLVCMATVFLVACLIIVGTMFVVTSQYQDMVVATMINMSNHQQNANERDSCV